MKTQTINQYQKGKIITRAEEFYRIHRPTKTVDVPSGQEPPFPRALNELLGIGWKVQFCIPQPETPKRLDLDIKTKPKNSLESRFMVELSQIISEFENAQQEFFYSDIKKIAKPVFKLVYDATMWTCRGGGSCELAAIINEYNEIDIMRVNRKPARYGLIKLLKR